MDSRISVHDADMNGKPKPPFTPWSNQDIKEFVKGVRGTCSLTQVWNLMNKFPSPYRHEVLMRSGTQPETLSSIRMLVRKEEFVYWYRLVDRNGKFKKKHLIIDYRVGDKVAIYEHPCSGEGLICYAILRERVSQDRQLGLCRWLCEHPKDCECAYCKRAIRNGRITIHDLGLELSSTIERGRFQGYVFRHTLSVWDEELIKDDLRERFISLDELQNPKRKKDVYIAKEGERNLR